MREKQREQLQENVACGKRLKEVVAFSSVNTRLTKGYKFSEVSRLSESDNLAFCFSM